MSSLTILHVVPSGAAWAVKRRGESQAARLAPTRDAAYEHARRIARTNAPARIVLHGADGAIESQLSVDGVPAGDWKSILTSAPVLTGIAGAVIVSAAAALFAWKR
jgi:hypothetical protein